ncbi:hypothetical protein C8F01DRAFT_512831 [Mycena amicta]|nr:hypothetical protein C8F01DRAFT_512831 [Mycena amicta]
MSSTVDIPALLSRSPSPQTPVTFAKDDKYFFESGDCTFLVEGVLFKLHKFNLCRDPDSMFSNMFKDANGEESEIIPLSDTADDFRGLCWAMYAIGDEIFELATQKTIADINVRKYAGILDTAHKYLLHHYEKLAWMIARANSSAVPNYIQGCSEDELEYMIGLAARCVSSAPELLALVEDGWLARIKQGQLSYSRALTAAELHGRRKFEGDVYMELRRKLRAGPPMASLSRGFSALNLTRVQLDRLLLGNALLSNVFSNLNTADAMPRTSTGSCSYHYECQDQWNNLCASVGDDPLARALLYCRDYQCIKSYLESMGITPQTQIADFFLGPEEINEPR